MMQLSDLWLYFLLAFALGFVLGWIRRWPVRS
jgi:membrane protease YdiL (CAAX protease family)